MNQNKAIEQLHEMGLFDEISLSPAEIIKRVPGGWVRDVCVEGCGLSTCFIPYNDEFKTITIQR